MTRFGPANCMFPALSYKLLIPKFPTATLSAGYSRVNCNLRPLLIRFSYRIFCTTPAGAWSLRKFIGQKLPAHRRPEGSTTRSNYRKTSCNHSSISSLRQSPPSTKPRATYKIQTIGSGSFRGRCVRPGRHTSTLALKLTGSKMSRHSPRHRLCGKRRTPRPPAQLQAHR